MLTHIDILFGLWFAFLGLFLENASSSSYRQANTLHSLQEITASAALTAQYPRCPAPTITVQELVRNYVLPTGYDFFPVAQSGELLGIAHLASIKAVPEQYWDITPLAQIVTDAPVDTMVEPEESGLVALERMEERDMNQILVVGEGVILGIVTRDSLQRAARNHSLGVKHGEDAA